MSIFIIIYIIGLFGIFVGIAESCTYAPANDPLTPRIFFTCIIAYFLWPIALTVHVILAGITNKWDWWNRKGNKK